MSNWLQHLNPNMYRPCTGRSSRCTDPSHPRRSKALILLPFPDRPGGPEPCGDPRALFRRAPLPSHFHRLLLPRLGRHWIVERPLPQPFFHLAGALVAKHLLERLPPAVLPPLRRHVGAVISGGPDEQVIGIHAAPVIAAVADEHACRDRAPECQPDPAMCQRLAVHPQ